MPVKQCDSGKWQIGTGKCMYDSKEDAESAYSGYRGQKYAYEIWQANEDLCHGPEPEHLQELYDFEENETNTEGGGNPPSWVADESKWDEAKDISRESYGEVRYPFVSWLYTTRLDGAKKGGE